MTTIYRAHTVYFQATEWVVTVLMTLVAGVWFVPLVAVGAGEPFSGALIRFPLFTSGTLIALGTLASMAIRDRCCMTLTLTDNAVVKDTSRCKQTLPFSAFRGFEYRAHVLGGGTGYVHAPGGFMTIPLALADGRAFLEDLRSRLAGLEGLPPLPDAPVKRFLADALLWKRILERLGSGFSLFHRTVVVTAAVSFLVSRMFWGFALPYAIVWTYTGVLFPLTGLTAAFFVAAARDRRRYRTQQDLTGYDDRIVFILSGLVAAAAYLVAGIVVSRTW